ncbi:hypothetical protein MAR_035666 [Mya arenaria]|uniref:Uncharacterized protein n=1 Tax=Mya arenaria TaxID=6604 RepID=A0ABY7EL77_MYAAR|nr:hypothetical protein MAR_035666 [Mya arenaria]
MEVGVRIHQRDHGRDHKRTGTQPTGTVVVEKTTDDFGWHIINLVFTFPDSIQTKNKIGQRFAPRRNDGRWEQFN